MNFILRLIQAQSYKSAEKVFKEALPKNISESELLVLKNDIEEFAFADVDSLIFKTYCVLNANTSEQGVLAAEIKKIESVLSVLVLYKLKIKKNADGKLNPDDGEKLETFMELLTKTYKDTEDEYRKSLKIMSEVSNKISIVIKERITELANLSLENKRVELETQLFEGYKSLDEKINRARSERFSTYQTAQASLFEVARALHNLEEQEREFLTLKNIQKNMDSIHLKITDAKDKAEQSQMLLHDFQQATTLFVHELNNKVIQPLEQLENLKDKHPNSNLIPAKNPIRHKSSILEKIKQLISDAYQAIFGKKSSVIAQDAEAHSTLAQNIKSHHRDSIKLFNELNKRKPSGKRNPYKKPK